MPQADSSTERVWARIPSTLSQQIEAQASAAGQSRAAWVRQAIVAALANTSSHNGPIASIEPVITRLKQLEMRLVHENSALIHLGLFLLRESVFASTAAMATATSIASLDEAGTVDEQRRLKMQAKAVYGQLEEEAISDLKRMRSKGKEAATVLGRAANGAGADQVT